MHAPKAHHRGCHSVRCDRRIDIIWARHHKPPAPTVTISKFDLCVANRENGEPGSTDYSLIDWHADNDYEGAYSEEHVKWEEGSRGLGFPVHAYDATPEQQTVVFEKQVSVEPGAWPNTVPPCMEYR